MEQFSKPSESKPRSVRAGVLQALLLAVAVPVVVLPLMALDRHFDAYVGHAALAIIGAVGVYAYLTYYDRSLDEVGYRIQLEASHFSLRLIFCAAVGIFPLMEVPAVKAALVGYGYQAFFALFAVAFALGRGIYQRKLS